MIRAAVTAIEKRFRRIGHDARRLRSRYAGGTAVRRIVFLHIPKCAGTSVNALLKSSLGSSRSGRTVLINDQTMMGVVLEREIARACNARFVGSHFGMDTLERVRGDAFTFTVLRDPFDRLRSIYGHLATRTVGNPLGDKVRSMPLAAFLDCDDDDVLHWSDNVIARMLAASHDRRRVVGLAERDLVRIAVERAGNLDHIAFADALDADIVPVAKAAGVSYDGKLPRENVTVDMAARRVPREAIEPMAGEVRRLAERRVGADLLVYEALRARSGRDHGAGGGR